MRVLAKRSIVNWQPALKCSWWGYSLFKLLPSNDFAPRRYFSYCTAQGVTHLMSKFCSGTFHQLVETIKAFSELHYCLNLSFLSFPFFFFVQVSNLHWGLKIFATLLFLPPLFFTSILSNKSLIWPVSAWCLLLRGNSLIQCPNEY